MKTLITAATIKQAKSEGQKQLVIEPAATIITPQAYDLAQEFGISIVDSSQVKDLSSSGSSEQPVLCSPEKKQEKAADSKKDDPKDSAPNSPGEYSGEQIVETIVRQVISRFPEYQREQERVRSVVQKVLARFNAAAEQQ